jgi:hypothetical protein
MTWYDFKPQTALADSGGAIGPSEQYLLAADTPCVPPMDPFSAPNLRAMARRQREAAVRDRRAAAALELARRWSIAWNIDSHPNVLDVPDFTRGLDSWPVKCEARWAIQARNPAYLYPRVFVCSRISDHTGRHAAGGLGRITAVWGDVP